MIEKISENKDQFRTSFFFLGLIVIFNLGIYIFFHLGVLQPLIVLTTTLASFLLNLVGIKNAANVGEIYLTSRVVTVTLECTAIYIIAVYAALVIVYPASRNKKLKGLLIGIPLILAANMVRLIVVSEILEKAPAYFAYTHDYIWNVLFIMIPMAIWFYWAKERSVQ